MGYLHTKSCTLSSSFYILNFINKNLFSLLSRKYQHRILDTSSWPAEAAIFIIWSFRKRMMTPGLCFFPQGESPLLESRAGGRPVSPAQDFSALAALQNHLAPGCTLDLLNQGAWGWSPSWVLLRAPRSSPSQTGPASGGETNLCSQCSRSVECFSLDCFL